MTSCFKQNGSSLLVVLVLLISLSVLTLSSTSDTNIQFQIVRNDQFYTGAYLSAYSEINAQLGIINANEDSDDDEKLLEMLTYEVGKPQALDPDQLARAHGAYKQEVDYTVTCDPNHCPSPPGYTMSDITKVLRARLDSRSNMDASGAASDQSQTFWYLLPQTDLVTFE